MNTLMLDGVEYVKASDIAKQFRYTSDYVGQLCRTKKVDARRIGRVWFVNPDSVLDHKKSKYSPEEETETVSSSKEMAGVKKGEGIKLEKKKILPVIKTKVAKRLAEVKGLPDTRFLSVKYSTDDENLMPVLSKKNFVSKTIPVNHTDAIDLKIEADSKISSFKSEGVPEVYLKGELKVFDIISEENVVSEGNNIDRKINKSESSHGLSEQNSRRHKKLVVDAHMGKMDIAPHHETLNIMDDVLPKKDEEFSDVKLQKKSGAEEEFFKNRAKKIVISDLDYDRFMVTEDGGATCLDVTVSQKEGQYHSVKSGEKTSVSASNTLAEQVSFVPNSVKKRQRHDVYSKGRNFSLLSYAVVFVFVIMSAAFVLTAGGVVEVGDNETRTSVVFQVANLVDFINR